LSGNRNILAVAGKGVRRASLWGESLAGHPV
jgi:hypothetical protein